MTDNLKQRLEKEDFLAVLQDHPIGQLIFKHLYTRFVTNKQFNKDPYIHAFNAGQAEVLHYLVRRMSAELAEAPKNNKQDWNLE